MYLRRLEIAGFKSFGNRVKLDFEPGVSAIVGPNGSGKSNIAEAVRWVLGERSGRTLRTAKAEELIFSGAQKGRAKASMAEVSMTLTGDKKATELATEELRITRKLYRSGESEYRINGRKVLARDLAKILAQAGFGVSSYTVIAQGMVEGLIIASPQERKLLFEEASGIRGFELERNEVLIRLRQAREQAEEMRREVDQLLPECDRIGQHVERLARRQEIASELKQLRKDFSWQEISRVHNEIKDLEKKIKDLEKQISLSQKQERTLQQKADELASTSEGFITKQSTILKALTKLDEERSDINEVIVRAEVEIELKKAELAEKTKLLQADKDHKQAQRQLSLLKKQLQDQTAKSEVLTQKIIQFDDKVRDLTKQLTTLRQALRANQRAGYLGQALGLAQLIYRQLTDGKELSKEQLRIVLHKLVRTVKLAHDSDLADAPEKIARLQQQIAREMTKREEIVEEQTTVIIRIRSLELDINAHEKVLENYSSPSREQEIKNLKQAITAKESKLSATRAKRDEYDAKQEHLRMELGGLSSHDTTQKQVDLAHQLEETHQSVRAYQADLVRYHSQQDEREQELQDLFNQAHLWGVPSKISGSIPAKKITRDSITHLEAELTLVGDIDESLVARHADLTRRIDYGREQALDMEQAVKDLEKVLDELARRIKTTFEKTFARINKAFGKNFAQLFSGGKATLTLSQSGEEDYGIDISVQPPGKRVATISALSGGEKALTAIALLSAILEVNPSPFVVLDEVDAALDDNNARLFQQTLTRLAKKSQILVITHNHETMVNADRLYGVTSSPRMASAVLSVELSEVEVSS